ncbi:MAG: GGDEF domain-containing protein [Dehalococcoidia bacterium]|nr:GGDEF domain-containing protein [Dehalococcoidia bacterium]
MKKLAIKWPNLEGRLDVETEKLYRLYTLREDHRQAAIGIALLALVVALTIPNDFVFPMEPAHFILLMTSRAIFIVYSIALILYLHRNSDPVKYDNNIFLWGLFGVAVNLLIIFSRPAAYTGHAMADVVILIIIYLGAPFRLLYRVILALLFTGGCLAYLVVNAPQLTFPWIRVEVLSLVFVNIVGLIISHHLYSYRRKQFVTQMAEVKAKEELRLAASRDSMTGILNHRTFFEQGERELKRFARYGKVFSLIEIDIDDFKGINDTHGHVEGDNVLLKLVDMVSSHIRQSDVFGRTGGDEFCILLIETNKADAMDIAERIRATCCNCRLNAATGTPIHFTVSVGLVESSKDDAGIGQMYSRADAAMYRAKREGHNRVCAD